MHLVHTDAQLVHELRMYLGTKYQAETELHYNDITLQHHLIAKPTDSSDLEEAAFQRDTLLFIAAYQRSNSTLTA